MIPSLLARSSGFTLLETAISLAVLAILLASVLSISVEASSFLSDNETDTVLQAEGSRTFKRLTDLLRKSGRAEAAGVTYPQVRDGGATLDFLILKDLDGNGYPFAQDTGGLEWDPRVFSLRTDADGNLGVYDGDERVYLVGPAVHNLVFQTINENPALYLKEIQVYFEVERTTRSSLRMVYAMSGSVHMRN